MVSVTRVRVGDEARHGQRRNLWSSTGWTGGFTVLCIAVAALSLRPAIVTVGPLSDSIRAGTGMGTSAISLLTTLPLVCLGVCAGIASPALRKLGINKAVLLSLTLIVAGMSLRLLTPLSALFVGSIIAATGIALGNVLVPAAVKQFFPHRLGGMMSLYSVALQTGATVASGLAAPLASSLGVGWRTALALWALPAAIALLAWLARSLRQDARAELGETQPGLWRARLGWACAGFIGLQSGVYFALTAWLPTLLQDDGMSTGTAGFMLLLVGMAGIVGGLPMPILAVRMHDQAGLVAIVVACFAAGLVGLLVAPTTATPVWAVLLGIAQGGGLSLALTLFTLRSRTSAGAAQLSGMAQSAGYVIAALGPFAAGFAHSLSHSWTAPLVVLLLTLVPLAATGRLVALPRTIEDELPGWMHTIAGQPECRPTNSDRRMT